MSHIIKRRFFTTVKIQKNRKGVVWWRTRDSLSHVPMKRLLAKPRSFSNLPAFSDFNDSISRNFTLILKFDTSVQCGNRIIKLFQPSILNYFQCKINCGPNHEVASGFNKVKCIKGRWKHLSSNNRDPISTKNCVPKS